MPTAVLQASARLQQVPAPSAQSEVSTRLRRGTTPLGGATVREGVRCVTSSPSRDHERGGDRRMKDERSKESRFQPSALILHPSERPLPHRHSSVLRTGAARIASRLLRDRRNRVTIGPYSSYPPCMRLIVDGPVIPVRAKTSPPQEPLPDSVNHIRSAT